MYEQFATKADLASYLDCTEPELPSDSNRLLKRASEEVYSITKFNYVSTLESHVLAVKMATLAQTEYWINAGENVAIVGPVSSMSAGKTSMSFDTSSSQKQICARATMYLNDAGLLYRGRGIRYRETYQSNRDNC